LNELCDLQKLHLHDNEGLCETRRLLAVKTPTTQNWIAYCFAAYEAANYKLGMELMSSINDIIETANADAKRKSVLKP